MAFSPFFFDVPSCSLKQIVNADSTNLVTVLTAAASGTKIFGIIAASDDTSDRTLTLGITRSGTFHPFITKTIPDLSGTGASDAAVNMLDTTKTPGLPYDNDGNPFLLLETGDTLQAKVAVAVTAAKAISINVVHGDDD
jgi:hypothetical protein